jgi:DNA polymerase III subunit delta'
MIITRYLIDNKDIPETQASRIAYLSNGSLQAALNHLKEADHDDFRNFTSWMRMTFADKGAQIIDFVDVLSKLGRKTKRIY